MFNGFGVYMRCDNTKFEGSFKNGKVDGPGLITFSNGSNGNPRQEGYFKGTKLSKRESVPEATRKARLCAQRSREGCRPKKILENGNTPRGPVSWCTNLVLLQIDNHCVLTSYRNYQKCSCFLCHRAIQMVRNIRQQLTSRGFVFYLSFWYCLTCFLYTLHPYSIFCRSRVALCMGYYYQFTNVLDWENLSKKTTRSLNRSRGIKIFKLNKFTGSH